MTAEYHPHPNPPPEGEGNFFFYRGRRQPPSPLRGKVGMGVGYLDFILIGALSRFQVSN
jgi:hypothetical protein